jgi:small subunit ribosomal protein S7
MRRRAAVKRSILPDPKYHSELLAKFVNQVMERGKKSVAEAIVYEALEIVSQKMKDKLKKPSADNGTHSDQISGVLDLFSQALENVSPTVEVRSRRVGGSTYQVPVEVPVNRRQTLGMRWLIQSARKRNEKSMAMRLANEMMEAHAGRGGAVRMCEDVRRMAKANQAFAHYRW